MEDKTQLVQDYMAVLLETGLSVEEVLKHGLEYLEHDAYEERATAIEIELLIAQAVRQAAKNLHIDADSQRQAYRRAYSPLTAIEFKKIYGDAKE